MSFLICTVLDSERIFCDLAEDCVPDDSDLCALYFAAARTSVLLKAGAKKQGVSEASLIIPMLLMPDGKHNLLDASADIYLRDIKAGKMADHAFVISYDGRSKAFQLEEFCKGVSLLKKLTERLPDLKNRPQCLCGTMLMGATSIKDLPFLNLFSRENLSPYSGDPNRISALLQTLIFERNAGRMDVSADKMKSCPAVRLDPGKFRRRLQECAAGSAAEAAWMLLHGKTPDLGTEPEGRQALLSMALLEGLQQCADRRIQAQIPEYDPLNDADGCEILIHGGAMLPFYLLPDTPAGFKQAVAFMEEAAQIRCRGKEITNNRGNAEQISGGLKI